MKYGFIGCGNMGGAVARAVCKGAGAGDVLLANRTPAKAQALAEELGCACGTNEEVASICDFIFLGVKPQMMEQMLSGLVPILKARKDRFVLASMAAGLDARRIQEMAGGAYPVICLMPNTPVAVGAGVVQYYGVDATEEELSDFQNLLSAAGMIDRVDPERLNAASAVSGCGPAFCAMFIEALADGGVACGLPRDKALAYAAKMAEGTARLMLENHAHPGQLKDGVCSPGGTTIQGVRTLEDRGFRSAVIEAVIAAYEKTIALGK